IEQARAGNFMNLVDPAANSAHALDWERAFLKTEISLFGRRVREALVTLEADGKKRSAVYADLEGIYRRAVASHRAITPGSDLSSAKRGFLDLVELAEKVAPVAKTFSWSNRARSVRYTDYWRDPYAYMVERDSLGGSHLSETETKDAFAKALERKSRFARWQERVKKKFVPGYESAAERQKLKAELARRYESGKLGSWEQVAEPMTDKILRGQSDLFRKNFRRLIQGALLPQFPEIEPLDRKPKLLVEQELNALVATLDEKLF